MNSSHRWVRALAIVAMLGGVGAGLSYVYAQARQTTAIESLLPAESIIYLGMDGGAAHEEAWKKTASYRALYESGLMEVVAEVLRFAAKQSNEVEGAGVEKGLGLIGREGFSLSVALPGVGAPRPYATVILHKGAPLEPGIAALIKQATERELKFETRTIDGREVTSAIIPDTPGVEVGWWTEGGHLVAVAGMNAVQHQIDVAAGRAPNITTNPLWKKYQAEDPGFERTSLGWCDFAALRTKFGPMPLPQAGPDAPRLTVDDVLKALGLSNLGAYVTRSGYKGEACWTKSVLEVPGERRGLLALGEQTTLELSDLPPLPPDLAAFATRGLDWSALYDRLTGVARDVAKLGPPKEAAKVERVLDRLPAMIGFDPKADLLDPLGNSATLYNGSSFGLFGTGAILKVDDPQKLKATLDRLLARASDEAGPNEFRVRRVTKRGRELVVLELGGGMFNPTFAIDGDWMAIGLVPQTVETFLLRVDGELPRWKPAEEWVTAFEALPKKFQSISGTDPRPGYRAMMNASPMIAGFIQGGLRQSGEMDPNVEFPVSVADLPPAELVTKPLFPNVSVCTVDETGFHWTTRGSLSSNPLLGAGGPQSIASVGILTALLLPAVQAAREAARRSNSANNLKQLGISLHYHHDTFKGFPAPAYPNDELKPDKRLSWMTRILPFIDEQAIYQRIDFEKAWDDDANKPALSNRIGVFNSPWAEGFVDEDGYGLAHYVGVAGYGKDPSKNPGIFGSKEGVRIRNITDGTSNTLLMIEIDQNFGPWGAAGESTVRGFTQKPYLHGPDGIGGMGAQGTSAALVDGSVHFLTNDTDPSVLEALSTYAGGENLNFPNQP